MTQVVLVSHGRLAESLLSTAQMIVGELHGVRTVALEPGMGTDEVIVAVREIVAEEGGGTLALLDLFGGSPATACARVLATEPELEVITGANLPMLLEVLLNMSSLDAKALARLARDKGKEGIIDIRAALGD